MEVLGIDIGGSGIKGAPVDILTGELTAKRYRIATPQPAAPENVATVVGEIARHFDWRGPIGCTVPGVVRHGVIYTAANVEDEWIGVDGVTLLEKASACPVRLLNDADAAGLAEMTLGAGRHQSGVVIMLTLGTGIGSAIFVEGHLLPNTEFGHLPIRGKIAEARASDRVRGEKNLSWKQWAKRVNEFLGQMEFFFSPDLFIIGGGVSKKHSEFFHYLETTAELVPAQLLNEAGIVGAALAARELASDA